MKFLDNVSFGQYIPSDSLIHRMDSRCKILATVIFITGVFLVKETPGFIFWSLLLLLITRLSRIGVSLLLRTVKPVMILIVFTAFINMFFTSGETLLSIGPLTVTDEGLRLGLYMGGRLLLLVLYANLLTLTTNPMALSDGIELLLTPFKKIGVPAHELAMMMTIALRFIPTLLNETDRIMKAQLARGADLDRGNIVRRLKAFMPVLIPLFVIVFQRADDLATAMEARCYNGGRGRTRMKPLVWTLKETSTVAFILVLTFSITYIERKMGI